MSPRTITITAVTVTALLLYSAICAAVWFKQRQLLYFPDPAPLINGSFIGAETLTLSTPDGEQLKAWWLPPPSATAPVALYLHGNGANLDNRADRLRLLRADGIGVLALSWRGYGGSTGTPSEAGWRQDALTAYAELRRRGIEPARIVLFGESLGSTHAVMLAAEQPVGALLLDSSFDSALAVAQGAYPWLPIRWLMRDPHRADLAAPKLQAPVMQVHCHDDRTIPLRHAQALQAALPKAGPLLVLEGDCHVPNFTRYQAQALSFIRQWIPGH